MMTIHAFSLKSPSMIDVAGWIPGEGPNNRQPGCIAAAPSPDTFGIQPNGKSETLVTFQSA
jgi:hypothetical protein